MVDFKLHINLWKSIIDQKKRGAKNIFWTDNFVLDFNGFFFPQHVICIVLISENCRLVSVCYAGWWATKDEEENLICGGTLLRQEQSHMHGNSIQSMRGGEGKSEWHVRLFPPNFPPEKIIELCTVDFISFVRKAPSHIYRTKSSHWWYHSTHDSLIMG